MTRFRMKMPLTSSPSRLFSFLALTMVGGVCSGQTTAPVPIPQAAGAAEAATFQLSSHLAVSDVVVTDEHGSPVHGLAAKDFRVFEDGVEQKVSFLEEHIGEGIGAAGARPVEVSTPPGVYSNAAAKENKSPLFVILLDSLNTAMSDQSFAQSELLGLVKRLPAGSRVAIFRLGGGLRLLQGFTENADDLARTIKSKKASPQLQQFFNDADMNRELDAPDLTDGMGQAGGGAGAAVRTADVQHTLTLQDPNESSMASGLTVTTTIDALKALGLYLSQFPGRKNLIWLSGTFPIDIIPSTGNNGLETSPLARGTDPFQGNRTHMIALRDLAVLLQSANIAVYPVDARGLEDNGMFGASGGGYGRASADAQNMALAMISYAGSNAQIHEIMRTIAHDTGGHAYYNTNDLKGSMLEAFHQGSNYYTLSYVPSNQRRDGKLRKLRIQVAIPRVKAYYRVGYYAEDAGTQKRSLGAPDPTMRSAMLRGSPTVSEITFQVKVRPEGGVRTIAASEPALRSRADKPVSRLKGPVVHYVLEYAIDPSQLQFYSSPSNLYRSRLTFSAFAFDKDGKTLNADVGSFTSPLSAQTLDAMRQDALHVKMGIDLPLQTAFLRVGVRDLTTEKIGAVEIPLDIPAALDAK